MFRNCLYSISMSTLMNTFRLAMVYSLERSLKGVPYEYNQEGLLDTGATTTSAETRAR